ncbi:MAG: acetyl-CoA C-acetyltransferase [Bdellovibrionales bacterium]|nr:acetyl-CoA C-acetyltransferase [Bdellovibrionales bacterium]
MAEVNEVVIVGGMRIPFARSMGKYMGISNEELMGEAIGSLVKRYNLQGERLGEVSLGAVMKHSKDWNMAREVTFGSGLSPETPAYDVQQACGTSLQTAILVGNKIALGQIEAGIAGGIDTNSDLPFVFSKEFNHTMLKSFKARKASDKIWPWFSLSPKKYLPIAPAVIEPRTKLSMGQSCELMAQEWGVTREEQDQLALESHHKCAAAYDEGFYDDLITPFHGLERDNNMRADTSLEKLAKLRPAFERSEKGTLTAGNSTPLTDGAACTLLASKKWAESKGLPMLAKLTFSETAAVDFVEKDGLLMAPAFAVPRMLQKAGISLQDFDFYEIHEAFAAQVLCTLKAWESEDFCKNRLGLDKALGSIDRSKLNVKGGSLAVGHPFAATGSRILASLGKIIHQAGPGKRGLISICTAGGMGVAAIVESL